MPEQFALFLNMFLTGIENIRSRNLSLQVPSAVITLPTEIRGLLDVDH